MAKASRGEIIEAAARLFNQNGYHATSMQDVAHAVDLRKPSLYHHFASKEAILLSILEAGMDRLIDELTIIASSQQDCQTKLRTAIHTHARAIANNPEGAAVFLREDRGLGDGYLAHYVAKRDKFEQIFRSIVQDGIAHSEFRSVDVPVAVQALLGMVNWMARWYHPDGRLKADQIADLFADLFLEGLAR